VVPAAARPRAACVAAFAAPCQGDRRRAGDECDPWQGLVALATFAERPPSRWTTRCGRQCRAPAGTDAFGHDVASRVVRGALAQVGIVSRVIALLIDTSLGLVAGYYGGRLDRWVMRLADVTLAYRGCCCSSP
jgi:ABC-type dipeptide/oligopeptide/nickel transport system permease subunit